MPAAAGCASSIMTWCVSDCMSGTAQDRVRAVCWKAPLAGPAFVQTRRLGHTPTPQAAAQRKHQTPTWPAAAGLDRHSASLPTAATGSSTSITCWGGHYGFGFPWEIGDAGCCGEPRKAPEFTTSQAACPQAGEQGLFWHLNIGVSDACEQNLEAVNSGPSAIHRHACRCIVQFDGASFANRVDEMSRLALSTKLVWRHEQLVSPLHKVGTIATAEQPSLEFSVKQSQLHH